MCTVKFYLPDNDKPSRSVYMDSIPERGTIVLVDGEKYTIDKVEIVLDGAGWECTCYLEKMQ